MRIVKAIGASIGIVLCFFYLGCGSMQIAQAGVPSISQVVPTTLLAGSNGATVRVLGSNFTDGTVVLWNGTPLNTTTVDDTTLASPVDQASLSMPGVAQLQVRNTLTGKISPAVKVSISSSSSTNSGTSAALAVSTTSVPSGVQGVSYSTAVTASGGTPTYTWKINHGSLPSGLTLSSNGTISGTPSVSGSYTFNVTVKDSSRPAQSASATLILQVAAPAVPALATSSTTLSSGTYNTAYSYILQATGGTPAYSWVLSSGSLPTGLTLSSTGVVSGTPTATGTFTFGATVHDSSNPAQTASATETLVVSATSLKITTGSLPGGSNGQNYSQSLQVSGGIPGYQWSIASGSLPAGLSLSSAGAISGTPTSSGTSTFSIKVVDSGNPSQSATASLSIPVAPSALTVTVPTLPAVTVGSQYSQSLKANGGTSPYNWKVASGSLPPGLSLSSTTGVISGTVASSSLTSNYTYNFTVAVTDTESTPQTATGTGAITLNASASPLSITSSTLPSGTAGTAYTGTLQANGGTPAYTWSITSGSLPAGLTLAATTGTISGTPTSSGTSSFTAKVTDSANPAQTQSVTSSITVAAATQSAPTTAGTTWYIRPDGGTRYSANVTSGQCDGKADVAYPGSGVNQHCAFKDFRYMWDDDSGMVGSGSWIMAGGDTVLIRGCQSSNQANASDPNCRLGWDGPTGPQSNNWCYGVGSYTCYNPPIPAGTAIQHTRILGQNYANCNAGGGTDPKQYEGNLTQLFGGFSLTHTFNLQSTQYVDIQCIELTTHNGVCNYGTGQPFSGGPRGCSSSQPLDDYAQNGFWTDNTTSNVTLQDVYVHGFNGAGFHGPIGGPITMTRVNASFNAFAGWNFDDGYDTPDAAGSKIIASYVTMIGNGCYEEYPVVHAFPARACYDSASGGFGDSWSGQDTVLDTFICDHCVNNYNTKDAFIGPHTQITNLSITNSTSIGNMGASWKWGSTTNANVLFQNNITVMNCYRMREQIPGAVQSFDIGTGKSGSYLSNYCRAGGNGFAIITRSGSNNRFYGNTIVAANATIVENNCGYYSTGNVFNQESNCGAVPNTWQDNVILGYTDPIVNNGQPGLWYPDPGSNVVFSSSHNVEYGIRNGDQCGTNGTICSDPFFVNEPSQSWVNETALDVFTLTGDGFHLAAGSPLLNAGVAISGLTVDYYGTARSIPPSIGAVEN